MSVLTGMDRVAVWNKRRRFSLYHTPSALFTRPASCFVQHLSLPSRRLAYDQGLVTTGYSGKQGELCGRAKSIHSPRLLSEAQNSICSQRGEHCTLIIHYARSDHKPGISFCIRVEIATECSVVKLHYIAFS